MVVLIDTNILLDVLLARQPYCEEALRVLKLAENGEIKGWIAANSVDYIYYISRRQLSPEQTRKLLKDLLQVVHVVSPAKKDLLWAIDSEMPDLEDAIQAALKSEGFETGAYNEAIAQTKIIAYCNIYAGSAGNNGSDLITEAIK